MDNTDTTLIAASAARIPDRILDAAAGLMEKQGYQGASMREIADAAGVAKSGLYYHVRQKEAILYAIHERFAGWLIERAEKVAAADLSAEAKLRELFELNLGAIARFKPEVTVFLREYWHLPRELRAVVDRRRDHYREIWEGVFRAGIANGEFRQGDAHLDALMALGAANWAYTWFDAKASSSAEEVATAFADRLLEGLRRTN